MEEIEIKISKKIETIIKQCQLYGFDKYVEIFEHRSQVNIGVRT